MILNFDDFAGLALFPDIDARIAEMALSGDHTALWDGPAQLWEHRRTQWVAQNRVDLEAEIRLSPSGVRIIIEGTRSYSASSPITLTSVSVNNTVQRQHSQPLFSERYKDRIALGDTTCINNARSPYLRCAINPCGPCEGCPDYESPGVGCDENLCRADV